MSMMDSSETSTLSVIGLMVEWFGLGLVFGSGDALPWVFLSALGYIVVLLGTLNDPLPSAR